PPVPADAVDPGRRRLTARPLAHRSLAGLLDGCRTAGFRLGGPRAVGAVGRRGGAPGGVAAGPRRPVAADVGPPGAVLPRRSLPAGPAPGCRPLAALVQGPIQRAPGMLGSSVSQQLRLQAENSSHDRVPLASASRLAKTPSTSVSAARPIRCQ